MAVGTTWTVQWMHIENPLTRNYQWFLKSDADFSNHVADDAWWNPTGAFYVDRKLPDDVPGKRIAALSVWPTWTEFGIIIEMVG